MDSLPEPYPFRATVGRVHRCRARRGAKKARPQLKQGGTPFTLAPPTKTGKYSNQLQGRVQKRRQRQFQPPPFSEDKDVSRPGTAPTHLPSFVAHLRLTQVAPARLHPRPSFDEGVPLLQHHKQKPDKVRQPTPPRKNENKKTAKPACFAQLQLPPKQRGVGGGEGVRGPLMKP